MTVSELRSWEKALDKVEFCTDDVISDRIAAQRAIKEPGELASIRTAQEIADKAFLHILNFIQTGRTEIEIAVELEEFCRRNGSEGPAFSSIIASGPNSSLPHAVPTNREVRTGDFVTMDFGCTVGGYCSDMTRTVAVGSVDSRQKELYETVLDAQLACIAKIKAGASCNDVHMTAQNIIDASEFKGMFSHGLGHCLGLEVHETPRCSRNSDETLEVGMVTSVEPGIYDAGSYGVRIEDIVIVTEAGCENLCTSPKELIIL
jgi:Xaa-Pro aminopeptidase